MPRGVRLSCAAWESAFYSFMEASHPEIGEEIIEKSVKAKNSMSDDLLSRMRAAIEEFKKTAAPQPQQ